MSDNNSVSKSSNPLMVPTVLLGILAILGLISGIMYFLGVGIGQSFIFGVIEIIAALIVLYACLNCYHMVHYMPTMVVVVIVTILSALSIIGLIIGLIVIYIIYKHKADFKS